jgi:thiamine transport system substrate-binding protein
MKKIISLILFSTLLFSSEKPLLTVYTYDSFTAEWGAGPKVKEAFEKAYHCRVKFVSTSSAIGTLRKIQIEGKRSKADILLGLDSATIPLAKTTGLFARHELDTSGLQLPVAFEDDTFIPYDYNFFAFVYDSRKLSNVPHSLEALAAMPEEFKIIIEDPRTSTIGFGLLLWVKLHYGDQAADFWHRLSPHILTVTKGWSEAYSLFLKGEADMVLSYTTSPAYHETQEHTTYIKAAHFSGGHYGQIEVAAILKRSKHKVLARKFLQWMQGREFASIIPLTNWSYPVVPVTLPKAYEHLIHPKMLMMQREKIQEGRKRYIQEWLRAIKR